MGSAARADGHVVHYGVTTHNVERLASTTTRVEGAASEQIRHRHQPGRDGQAGPQDQKGKIDK